MTDQTTPEQPPAPSEIEQLRDSVNTLQTIVNRVREAVGTDEPAPVRETPSMRLARAGVKASIREQIPAADGDAQTLRWARRESLLVLVTRAQCGHPLAEDEVRTLREHVETEMREAEAARADVARYEEVQGEMNERAIDLTRRAERAEATLERVRDAAKLHRQGLLSTAEVYAVIGPASLGGTEPATAATEATEPEKTARVFAALHRSAEQDVSRVIDLYERWVKAGPPPLGTSVSRWWDAHLVELHDAICPPDGTERSDPTATEPRNGNHTPPSLVIHTTSTTPPTENA